MLGKQKQNNYGKNSFHFYILGLWITIKQIGKHLIIVNVLANCIINIFENVVILHCTF